MKITIDIDDSRIEDIARETANTLLSDRARYGESLRYVIVQQVNERMLQFDVSAIVEKVVHQAVQRIPELVSTEVERKIERLVKERVREHTKIKLLLKGNVEAE